LSHDSASLEDKSSMDDLDLSLFDLSDEDSSSDDLLMVAAGEDQAGQSVLSQDSTSLEDESSMDDLDLSSFDLSDEDSSSDDLLTVVAGEDQAEQSGLIQDSTSLEDESSMDDLDLSLFDLSDESSKHESLIDATDSLILDGIPLDGVSDDESQLVAGGADDLLIAMDDALASKDADVGLNLEGLTLPDEQDDATEMPDTWMATADDLTSPDLQDDGLGLDDLNVLPSEGDSGVDQDDMMDLTRQMSALNALAGGLDEMPSAAVPSESSLLDDLGDIEMIDLDDMDHDADLEEFSSTIQATLKELGVEEEPMDDGDDEVKHQSVASSDFDAEIDLDQLLSDLDDLSKS